MSVYNKVAAEKTAANRRLHKMMKKSQQNRSINAMISLNP